MGDCKRPGWSHDAGQTLTETAVLAPLFFTLVFALLQVCHLGLAVAIVNYGASSAARLAVEQNDTSGSNATTQFKKLLAAGLTAHGNVQTRPVDQDSVTQNLVVTACAQLPAYPFVGELLDKALSSANGTDCAQGAKMMGPIGLTGPPYYFIIEGQAKARMNYQS